MLISPNRGMTEELRPLMGAHLGGASFDGLHAYPSTPDLKIALGVGEGVAAAGSTAAGTPHLILLDVVSNADRAQQLLTEILRIQPGARVVALLSRNDPDLVLRCLRAGAADFLIQPFTAEQIEGAVAKLARLEAPAAAGKEPVKIIAVMPVRGACGATTVAFNLAFQLKRLGAKRILLADLDPLAGTISFRLKTTSTYSFLDVLIRAHELDEGLWSAMVTPAYGVDVLTAPEARPDGGADVTDPSPILEYARRFYDEIVTDTGSVYGAWNLNQARAATEIFLVTTNELLALHAAQRALSYFDANGIDKRKVRLVVNNYSSDTALSREQISEALNIEIFGCIPSDDQAVRKSLMNGQPIPAGTPSGDALAKLANHLNGCSEEAKDAPPKGRLLAKLLKK